MVQRHSVRPVLSSCRGGQSSAQLHRLRFSRFFPRVVKDVVKVVTSCVGGSELHHSRFSHFFPRIVKDVVKVMTSRVGGSELYHSSFTHLLPGVVKSHSVLSLCR